MNWGLESLCVPGEDPGAWSWMMDTCHVFDFSKFQPRHPRLTLPPSGSGVFCASPEEPAAAGRPESGPSADGARTRARSPASPYRRAGTGTHTGSLRPTAGVNVRQAQRAQATGEQGKGARLGVAHRCLAQVEGIRTLRPGDMHRLGRAVGAEAGTFLEETTPLPFGCISFHGALRRRVWLHRAPGGRAWPQRPRLPSPCSLEPPAHCHFQDRIKDLKGDEQFALGVGGALGGELAGGG